MSNKEKIMEFVKHFDLELENDELNSTQISRLEKELRANKDKPHFES